jgi:hypothetical protein
MHYRWIDLIFSLSGFRNSDSFLALIAKDLGNNQLQFESSAFRRMLVLLTMNSQINVDFDNFWRADAVASAIAFFNYISSRYVFSRRAFEFRERLLEWIPARLGDVKLGSMTLARIPEVFMHCSYAVTPKKHEIKRPLMEQIRRACVEAGVVESRASLPARSENRATVIVVGEQFTPGHAIFRTHSRAVKSLRERYRVVGLVFPNTNRTAMAEYFDEMLVPPPMEFIASIGALAVSIMARQPVAIFYPSIGMVPQVIALAALRLAPIQCASYGHMATTMSPAMDYIIFPEDFVAATHCFSEKVVKVPKAAMPFVPRPAPQVVRPSPDRTVRVAIPASTMKLNPLLFDALVRIGTSVKAPVAFHFFPLCATGLPYFELSRIVRRNIPNATVFPEFPHDRYMEHLAHCDLFLCPFPYGNTNSIVDAFQLGLPGICLDGEEAHAHTDTALFARIGMPAELSAKSIDEYVAAAVKMVDDEDWRHQCTGIVRRANFDEAFFGGDPSLFCAAMENLIWPPTA